MSAKGKLSGSFKTEHPLELVQTYLTRFLAPNFRIDYTQHDRDFERTAQLICENCEWGYLDTLGNIAVEPQYTFARNFVNEVGIIECAGKKGMINRGGETLIPCNYDGIDFLEALEQIDG